MILGMRQSFQEATPEELRFNPATYPRETHSGRTVA
jgi:hypothetical protein